MNLGGWIAAVRAAARPRDLRLSWQPLPSSPLRIASATRWASTAAAPSDRDGTLLRELQVQPKRMGNLAHLRKVRLTRRAARKMAKHLVRQARVKGTTVEKLQEQQRPRPAHPLMVAPWLASSSAESIPDRSVARRTAQETARGVSAGRNASGRGAGGVVAAKIPRELSAGAWRAQLFSDSPDTALVEASPRLPLPPFMASVALPEHATPSETIGAAPFLRGGVRPSEARAAVTELAQSVSGASAAAVRQLVALEHAAQSERVRFDVQRMVQWFQRRDGDTGSSEVQAAVLTVRLANHDRHLSQHRKDHATRRRREMLYHQRRRVMRYLRRTDLEKFVYCSKALGVDPASIY